MTWIRTATGLAFDFVAPTAAMVSFTDMAHALTNIPRFGGQAKRHYSVGHHTLFCVDIAARLHGPLSPFVRESAGHDAHEAYVGDVPSPLKRLLPDYRAVEERVARVVREALGVPLEMSPEVKAVDALALVAEAELLHGAWPEWAPQGDVEMARELKLDRVVRQIACLWPGDVFEKLLHVWSGGAVEVIDPDYLPF